MRQCIRRQDAPRSEQGTKKSTRFLSCIEGMAIMTSSIRSSDNCTAPYDSPVAMAGGRSGPMSRGCGTRWRPWPGGRRGTRRCSRRPRSLPCSGGSFGRCSWKGRRSISCTCSGVLCGRSRSTQTSCPSATASSSSPRAILSARTIPAMDLEVLAIPGRTRGGAVLQVPRGPALPEKSTLYCPVFRGYFGIVG